MSGLNVHLTGNLIVAPAQDCTSSDNTMTRAMVLMLQSETQAADACIGQGLYQVVNAANEVLAFPVNFSARLFVLRVVNSGTLQVAVTYATAGEVVLQTNGLLVLEQQYAERILAVSVTGSAVFEWAATGPNAN